MSATETERDTCELSSYTELADIVDALPLIVRETRRSRRLSLAAAGAQIGCAASTLLRLESGEHGVATDVLVRILRWLSAAGGAR